MSFVLEGVDFGYDGRPVIRGLDLALPPGRFYGVLGPNGSGKTTLIDLLSGHRPPDAGTIRYRDRPLGRFSRREMAREMALVPQQFAVDFPFTVAEVVLMGRYPHIPRFAAPTGEDRAAVARVMEQTGIGRFADRRVTELSGGERQRVVFARALAQETPVLLLDEATASLDVKHTLALAGLVAERVRSDGQTAIAVLHDMNLAAAWCDDLLFLRDGRKVAFGPVAEVFRPEVIEETFEVPARVYDDPFTGARKVSFVGADFGRSDRQEINPLADSEKAP